MKSHLFFISALLMGSTALAEPPPLTTDTGSPVGTNQSSKTAGPRGGILLEDFHLIEKLARFDRERIPERVVHARGVGAYGTFESAGDFSQLTRASIFSAKGKKTPMFVRFSTVIHPQGSPETLRDPRGFALKFYTDEGNWDLVGNNLPVFFIRDAIKFPDMVHSLKPSPITNRQEPGRFFDFFSHQPESTHMLTQLYSDIGIPANYRQMNGHGVHSFKFVNAKGEMRYVKFNWRSLQGVKSLTAEEAARTQAQDFQHATQDLYTSIGKGQHPSWELSVQVLDPKDLDAFSFDPLDATKVWPEDKLPPTVLGKFTLNRTPDNFFEETEQAAFSPGVMPPGIEPSEDRLLQGRLFSYADTQRYRVGANYQSLPVNKARAAVNSNNQAGSMNSGNTKSDVNYEPSVAKETADKPSFLFSQLPLSGTTQQATIAKTDNFSQAGAFYAKLSAPEKERLVKNLAGDLNQVSNPVVKARMVGFFFSANPEYGTRLAKAVGVSLDDAKATIAPLATATP
ncbi:catalase [Stigmatella aurantiaca]|uniref:Catalase n=1 Tax=Stigmatella aurantiaca (strain DW4/3-1) TaxID=378806 RepID=Q08SM8_STIAD|nr:catalase [Stigmatella aurantiaca]ADO72528.1 Catalase KatB [Stigmatella aurantiaca DW4/3-1]EAU63484.1 catalase [Stigmatella aurantiaca DW4/3-1]